MSADEQMTPAGFVDLIDRSKPLWTRLQEGMPGMPPILEFPTELRDQPIDNLAAAMTGVWAQICVRWLRALSLYVPPGTYVVAMAAAASATPAYRQEAAASAAWINLALAQMAKGPELADHDDPLPWGGQDLGTDIRLIIDITDITEPEENAVLAEIGPY